MNTRTRVLDYLRAGASGNTTPMVTAVNIGVVLGVSTAGVTVALRELAAQGRIRIACRVRGPVGGGTSYELRDGA